MIKRTFLFIILTLSCSILHVHALPDDENQLIKIQADNAFHDNKKGLTLYSGDVFMQQGSLKINADKITISSKKNGDVNRLEAQGKPAKFQQQPEVDGDIVYGHAQHINYQVHNGEINFDGDAFIQQGEAKLNSDKITYITNQQVFKAQRSPESKGKPQRVEMIIPPKKDKK